jgi:hypothetical protein
MLEGIMRELTLSEQKVLEYLLYKASGGIVEFIPLEDGRFMAKFMVGQTSCQMRVEKEVVEAYNKIKENLNGTH